MEASSSGFSTIGPSAFDGENYQAWAVKMVAYVEASIAVFLLNRLPTKVVEGKTPYEAWYGVKPVVKNLRVFGCLCYSHVPQTKMGKLDEKSEPDDWTDEMIDDEPVRGTRPLAEIYQRSNVAVFEPANFEEAYEDQKRISCEGYAQVWGVDYSEIFAPVARLDTIRLLFAIATKKSWKIFQLDVKSAFLNGVLEKEIYVEQPEGFAVKGVEDKVYRLIKALYGLKQAPRAWYNKIAGYLQNLGFERSLTKRVVRYLKGTATFGIKFTKGNQFKLSGFVDNDCAGCVDYMRSTSGYCFTLSLGCISWSSKKQEGVAQSTVEAEFMAATVATNQAIWLRKLLMDLGFQQE
ncbi:hypothetical protein CRG98_000558 [Punica granatum]|uniref:Reverse transcriptase Ty1/copia-type domain-containing protein n=1 Tax=Punica granatum TaxID=22663 RepID=A0A2I0LEG7_PUNGR|nr:hypothetical protein CRG98_000558 [Punica granatum]